MEYRPYRTGHIQTIGHTACQQTLIGNTARFKLKAASLLLENKYRVSEICYMIGFSNPSYFSKCFQKQFGMKPGEFAISGGNKQMEE